MSGSDNLAQDPQEAYGQGEQGVAKGESNVERIESLATPEILLHVDQSEQSDSVQCNS